MKLSRWLSVSVLALSFVTGIASADEPSLLARMQQHVDADLVKPLTAHDQETSRFSRMRTPPRERRARVSDATPSRDQAGQTFLPFALDARIGTGAWRKDDVVGCVYPEKGDMFVKVGDSFRPASFLLGVVADPVAGVCQVAPPGHA